MQYDDTKSAKEENGVGLGFTLSYPKTPTAGQYNQIRLSVDNPLQQYDDGTQAAVSDFEILIEATSQPSIGTTGYDLDSTDSVKPDANKPSLSLANWVENIIEDTAKFASKQADPMFSIFIGAVFELAKKSNSVREQNGKISIRDTPITSRRTKIMTEQRSQVFQILISLMLATGVSKGQLSGTADYQVQVSADTHKVDPRAGPSGMGIRTGSITTQSTFSMDWK